MPRETTAFPLSLPAAPPGGSLYRWLYGELRAAILDGRLRPGARLPATRDLASAYHLSRATIVTAFDQLKSEGYVEGRSGSGTYVSEVLPEHLLDVHGPHQESRLPHRRIALSSYARRLQPFRGSVARPLRAFRAHQPALDLFPTNLWAQVAARRLRRVSASLLAGGEALGYRPLREAVAAYLNISRGVKCTAEQVLIVSGAQEALDRTARILLNPGESAWMEEPGYSGRPIPAMQGLDRSGVVIFAGSFSAVLFPALRLGYLVVPPEMVDIFAAAESVTTHHPPLLEQAVLCDFITEGHFARHIRRMR